jgi:hypothetical protein
MRRTLIPLALILCVLLAPAAASARPTVGIGDQNPTVFQDRKMQRLKHLKVARLVIEWDWYKDAEAAAHARWWMSTVTAAHMRPLVTFNRNWRYNGRKKLPSMAAYKKSFKLFRKQFPTVRDFSPWNEPNAKEQPFYRRPAVAARYFNAMRRGCLKCTVVAGDINDGPNMLSWLKTYKRHVYKAKVWALHNYKDSTSQHSTGTTRLFLRRVRGSVWLTETGGLIKRGGLKGQARAVKRIFQLAGSSKRIKRLYFYQWRAVRRSHWDSAFLTRKGKPRPAYYTLRTQLKRHH